MSLFWPCSCGYKEFRHRWVCSQCGGAQPLPQHDPAPKFVRHNSTPQPVPTDDVDSPNPGYYGY